MINTLTFEKILQRMLDKVPDTLDKREGSIIYDALAPCAIELNLMYIEIENLLKQVFAQTADRDSLILKAKEHDLMPTPATKAIIKGEFKNAQNELMNINTGARFSVDALNFEVSDKIDEGVYSLKCEQAGEVGNINVPSDLIPIDYIENLASARAVQVLEYAQDEEDTEHFRQRYFIQVREPATSGNIYHYRKWALEVSGVGAVKVFPLMHGAGTVEILVVNSDFERVDGTFTQTVKRHIESVRPIGATVTVVGGTNKDINISVTVQEVSGYDKQIIKQNFKRAIKEYFKEIVKDYFTDVFLKSYNVSIAQIGKILLSIEGVEDYSNLQINSTTSNIGLSLQQIPNLASLQVN